ncbi:TraU family protein [Pelobacter propionicus]|uniref:TraU family protein n=1 Tax=Pelobacter propionicus (strain DSM 2379 / NBRC 103807 / OttBd1) TaxID=338966 RepID=A0R7Q3_PELPD|nr:TraU family protein [Pelobacter propionicus]ABL01361.1 TraU family protein [Pelobacter propionicus DSM 2379]
MTRIVVFAILLLCAAANSFAGVINPVTDVCWRCMFPMTTGGVSWGDAGEPAAGNVTTPVCTCVGTSGVRIGVTASFNEHAWLIESVKTPYYFPALGTKLNNTSPGYNAGDTRGATGQHVRESFHHVHQYTFPVYGIVGLFLDMPCLEQDSFDLAYMTEVDDMWSEDLLAMLINPEALAFGNPVTQMSCISDAVAAGAGYPIDSLFWCFGSWGSSYPLTGTTVIDDPVTAAAATASRMIFKLGREGALWDTGIDECSSRGVLTPFMVKSHYKFQIARPVVGNQCVPIGRTALLWGPGKNPIVGGAGKVDEFLWVATRRRVCCVAYNLTDQ